MEQSHLPVLQLQAHTCISQGPSERPRLDQNITQVCEGYVDAALTHERALLDDDIPICEDIGGPSKAQIAISDEEGRKDSGQYAECEEVESEGRPEQNLPRYRVQHICPV